MVPWYWAVAGFFLGLSLASWFWGVKFRVLSARYERVAEWIEARNWGGYR